MWVMLQEWEDFMWNEIKIPLNRVFDNLSVGIITFRNIFDVLHAFRAMRKFPEPTQELDRLPCSKRRMMPNTRRLIEVRDEFYTLQRHGVKLPLFRLFFNLIIILYDSYPFYRHRLDWVIERLADMLFTLRWIPRSPLRPLPESWREWDTGGEFKRNLSNREHVSNLVGVG